MSNPPVARRAAGNSSSGKKPNEPSLHPHELQAFYVQLIWTARRAQLKRALRREISQREIDILSEIVACTMAIRRASGAVGGRGPSAIQGWVGSHPDPDRRAFLLPKH